MKKSLYHSIVRSAVIMTVAAFVISMSFPLQYAEAATLTTPRDYLSRAKENLTSGVQHEVFFTTVGAVSGGAGLNEVILVFPDADDAKWCATAGAGTAAGPTNPTGGSESATSLPGTLTVACTQGAGASSYDTITVSGVDDLSTTTKYGVRLTDTGVANFGTPANTTTGLITIKTNNGSTDIDTADTAEDIIADDQVVVSAAVPPSITFTVSANTINLGTLSAGSVSTSSHTVRTVTNATSGYTSLVYDDGNLRNGASDINDVGDGAVTSGAEEYGISTTDTGQDIVTDGGGGCSGSTFDADPITTTQQTVAGAGSGPADETSTVCYMASITSSTVSGAYQHTVTYVTVGLF
ncbi:MAG TPA: hypothetical protein DIS62_04585 [Candidatus Kerfeldbacteria bacterium]|nr:hypothetical protein [Candidatus Kerfeldbacteria bacterium]